MPPPGKRRRKGGDSSRSLHRGSGRAMRPSTPGSGAGGNGLPLCKAQGPGGLGAPCPRPAGRGATPARDVGASTRPPSGWAQAGASGRAPPSHGSTKHPFTPGGAAGAWRPPWGAGQLWPYASLPAVWKLEELSLSTTVGGTTETRGPCLSRWSYPGGDSHKASVCPCCPQRGNPEPDEAVAVAAGNPEPAGAVGVCGEPAVTRHPARQPARPGERP